MSYYTIACLVILFSVVIHYLNHRFIKIQSTIAITLGAVVVSLVVLLGHAMGWFNIEPQLHQVLREVDFKAMLLDGMLGFLLFAGALTVDLKTLFKFKWEVGTLAFLGTLASTFVVGSLLYVVLGWLGLAMPYLFRLIFGALISPTDPIAVLATLKEIMAPHDLSIKAAERCLTMGLAL